MDNELSMRMLKHICNFSSIHGRRTSSQNLSLHRSSYLYLTISFDILSLVKSIVFSFTISSALRYLFLIISSFVTLKRNSVVQLGLLLSFISLLLGMFFFLYSVKYYFTIAVVLSFSQNGKQSDQITSPQSLSSPIKIFINIDSEEKKKYL